MSLKRRLKSFRYHVDPILREVEIVLKRMKENPFSLSGIVILLIFLGIAVFAPVIAPPKPDTDPYILTQIPYAEGITPPPTPPSPKYPFGTVAGYNIYYGCVWGTRTAFRIGLQVTVIALLIGLIVGCFSGYFGGLLDGFLMLITDIFSGLPSLLLAMVLIASTELPSWLGPTAGGFWGTMSKLDKIVFSLALTTWTNYARLVRGQVIKVKNEDYVEAAKAIGCSNLRIIGRHIFPNSLSPVIAMASLNIGGVILTAATLSFLGIGIPAGYADWAPFIASSRDYIIPSGLKYWYSFLVPSIFLIAFVLGWTLLGDALREMQDPRTRRM